MVSNHYNDEHGEVQLLASKWALISGNGGCDKSIEREVLMMARTNNCYESV